MCNALFLIQRRLDTLNEPSGIAEDTLLEIQLGGIGTQTNAEARTAEDLAALRAVPGVVAATVTNQVPFYDSSSNTGLALDSNQARDTINVAQYEGADLSYNFV